MPENANSIRSVAIIGTVRQILAREAGDRSDQASLLEAAESVFDKLRIHLSRSIGQEGFRTLLMRALTLAKTAHPSLTTLTIGLDGSLIGLQAASAQDTSDTRSSEIQQDFLEGAIAVVGNFLELLTALIGDQLTLRILSTVWTELALDGATDWENEK